MSLIVKFQPKQPAIVPYEIRIANKVAEYQMEKATGEQLIAWEQDNEGYSDLAHAARSILFDRGLMQPKGWAFGCERDIA